MVMNVVNLSFSNVTDFGSGPTTPDYDTHVHSSAAFGLTYGGTISGYDMVEIAEEINQLNEVPEELVNLMELSGASEAELNMTRELIKMSSPPKIPQSIYLVYLVFLIPLFGIVILVLDFKKKLLLSKIVTLIAGLFSLGLFLVIYFSPIVEKHEVSAQIVASLLSNLSENAGWGSVNPENLPTTTLQFGTISIGLYLMLLASIGFIVSFFATLVNFFTARLSKTDK